MSREKPPVRAARGDRGAVRSGPPSTIRHGGIRHGGSPRPNRLRQADRLLQATCRGVALFGGAVLIAIATMSVISISGRWFLNTTIAGITLGPVPGDFELVEMGTAMAVFCFLPQAQLARAHVTVDLFTMRAGPVARRMLGAAADLIFAATAALLCWRLSVGLGERLTYGETTMILALPQWWVYVPGVAFMALTTLACLSTLAHTMLGAVPQTEAEMASAGHATQPEAGR